MDHGHCLQSLLELGASPGSVRLVDSFLKDRLMTLYIRDEYCSTWNILRGSPQGSVLGCLLYCVTTQRLTKNMAPLDRRAGGFLSRGVSVCVCVCATFCVEYCTSMNT